MRKGTRRQATVHIDAPPEKVYELVSDVTRMGRWSPETVRARWIGGATGPAIGARFRGTNRRGPAVWVTTPKVVAAEPGREFAFVVPMVLVGRELTKWTYRFDPAAGGGTTVTESFETLNDIPSSITFMYRTLMRIKDREVDLEAGMQRTLERIKAAAEDSS
jgi:uncharacterized protein YndB with AHSA1/START domain